MLRRAIEQEILPFLQAQLVLKQAIDLLQREAIAAYYLPKRVYFQSWAPIRSDAHTFDRCKLELYSALRRVAP